ncbi:hypothetical protein [Cerasicoccus fimbriatus]|uniref:hypothetical protein n=1 Tax=Cerasicoccus fimbriatus TaxID=3014554 RepID=UPI0022B2EE91|nr:hypothetical protein [Cerasicoccus sp. TK19100]
MRKPIAIASIAVAITAAGFLGALWERKARSEFVYEQWQTLYGWTDSEGIEFQSLIEDIEVTPEQVRDGLKNMIQHNKSMSSMMENDESMTAIVCLTILGLLEDGDITEARTFCISRLAYYANSPVWPDSEISDQREKIKEKILALAESIPDLRTQIDNQSE